MRILDRMKSFLALFLCAALFFVALGMSILFEIPDQSEDGTQTEAGIVISEIMSKNLTYPDQEGRLLDYIEICNLSGQPVDISNYKLSDDEAAIGYTFPQGTVLPANGYIVCWCDALGGEGFASFGISKDGGEEIYLYNSANVIIDRVAVPALEENTPYVRQLEGLWSIGGPASPGYENTAEGNAQWLDDMGYRIGNVVISEIQSSNDRTWMDSNGTVCDWIELYNAGNEAVVLDGAYLSDDPADPLKWSIPELTIEPGGYAVIRCGGSDINDAKFGLSREGCSVALTGKYANPICSLECPALPGDGSYALQGDGTYEIALKPTPGFSNDEDGRILWMQSVGISQPNVVISEVQTSNRSAILDSKGNLCDWVELYNYGQETVDLSGTFLTDDPSDLYKWQIGDLLLGPGERVVIPCVGAAAAPGEADFALPRSGCTLVLSGPVGNEISRVECPAMEEDRSWQLLEDGTYVASPLFSPGCENDSDGYELFREGQRPLGPLMVSEVMPSNDRYLIQSDGEYYDWLELKNISDAPIDLSSYAVSDNSSDLLLCPLPARVLEPGETVVVICSGKTELSGSFIHAPFTLNREECWVYVSHVDSGLSDYVRISGVPLMGSAGKMDDTNQIYYFSNPTPGAENANGMAAVADVPFVETPDGVYNDVESVEVVLSGEGQIYYTLDGSEPALNSNLYTQPLTLTKTTVVRAKSFCQGKLPSKTVTVTYIINEHHTLPVISIAASDSDLFGSYGIYTNYTKNWEVPCNLTLYEGDEGFSIDCGIKMFGHTGLQMAKKSFKVNFRSCYGAKHLNYPVYGEDGPVLYDSLIIRSGQDYPQAIFRDELFTSLCRDMSDSVLAQRDKFCILYINGEYFGIYCMKEAFSEMFYAQNRGVSEESVEVVQAPVYYDTEIHEFMRFLINNKMALDENYEYACTVFDMDSVIDWMIAQGYSTNGDVQQNLRYFRSTENGNRYEMAFYDLDWSFYYHTPFMDVLGPEGEWQHLMLTRGLMRNPTFRRQFLERLSYHMENTLSNESVLARIDYYHDLLAPEVPRERRLWGGTYETWELDVAYLRDFITKRNHLRDLVIRLIRYIDLTQEEIDTYFWRWY